MQQASNRREESLEAVLKRIARAEGTLTIERNPFEYSGNLETYVDAILKNANVTTLKFLDLRLIQDDDQNMDEINRRVENFSKIRLKRLQLLELATVFEPETLNMIVRYLRDIQSRVLYLRGLSSENVYKLNVEQTERLFNSLQDPRNLLVHLVFECRFSTDAFRILSDRLPELPNLRGIGFRGALQPAQHDIAYLLSRLADCKLLSFRMPISSWKNVGIQEAFAQFLEKQADSLESLCLHVLATPKKRQWFESLLSHLENLSALKYFSMMPCPPEVLNAVSKTVKHLDIRGLRQERFADIAPVLPNLENLHTFEASLKRLDDMSCYDVFSNTHVVHFSVRFDDSDVCIRCLKALSQNPFIRRLRFSLLKMSIAPLAQIAQTLAQTLKSTAIVELSGPLVTLIDAHPGLLEAMNSSQILSILDIVHRERGPQMEAAKESCRNHWSNLMSGFHRVFEPRVCYIITEFCGVVMHFPDYDADYEAL